VKRDDIRGVYGEAIDRGFARSLGVALADTFRRGTAVEPVNVVVGYDMRLSGPDLAAGLQEGLRAGGCRPIVMGLAGTELVGFLPARYPEEIDGGVIITASHNPKNENGFKFFGRGGMPLPLASRADAPCPGDAFQRLALALRKRAVPDELAWDDFAPDYIRTILERGRITYTEAAGRGDALRIAVEAGNGMGGRIIGELAKLTGQFDWHFSNELPDGNFPVIIPNPLRPEYQQMVAELVQGTDSDIGLCFDGDADRVSVFDEGGQVVSPGQVATLVGQRLRTKFSPDARVAANLASSWVVADTLGDRHGVLGDGLCVMTPVGYGKIKAVMYDDPRIALGAEHSGHYMFREFWCADSGMMVALLMIEMAAELHGRGEALSSCLRQMRGQYFESGEQNYLLRDDVRAQEVIEAAVTALRDEIEALYVVSDDRCRLVESYPPSGMELSVPDVRAESKDWWFCMRPSGTENALRFYVEAHGDPELMAARRSALCGLVEPYAARAGS
jgi:phosphomannomutase